MNATVSIINDQFTSKTADHGNKKLEYPVGLLTADEMVAAGIPWFENGYTNRNNYLYKSENYSQLSLSPSNVCYQADVFHNGIFYNPFDGTAYVGLFSDCENTTYKLAEGFAPTINLNSEYAKSLIGDGSFSNPYQEV